VVTEGFKFIILIKSIVIIYIINLQYILITKIVNVNCKCYSYGVQNKGGSVLFLLFFYLPLGLLFLLNLFLKLR